MIVETALPPAEQATAGVQIEAPAPEPILEPTTGDPVETKVEGDPPVKKEKEPWEREIARKDRRIDTLTRREASARAELDHYRRLQQALPNESQSGTNGQDDDQPVSLTRKQIDALVTERAAKLAPTIKQQGDVEEQRRSVVAGLAKEWGQEKFDAYANDLEGAFDGLKDRSGRPKPATEAIFESDTPAALIEYLADPENAEEAEALGRMNDRQAARAVTKLEAKLQADAKQAKAKAKAKPEPSNAAAPIEAVRGGGTVNSMPDPSNTKAYIKWANEQDRRR